MFVNAKSMIKLTAQIKKGIIIINANTSVKYILRTKAIIVGI